MMQPATESRYPTMAASAGGSAVPPPQPHAMASAQYAGHHHQQQQQQQQQQQPAYKGTLAPGTRVMIGQIVVIVQRYLSQGGFAHVYLVTTEKPLAIPVSSTSAPGSTSSSTRGETLHVLKRMAVPDKEALAGVRSEVEVHKSLRNHPNIVQFIEASATALNGGGYEIFILMEYCSGGGVLDLMNTRLRNRLTEPEVLKIFGDVAAGLSVMHHSDPPLMHRDLKVENILLAPPPRSNTSAGPTYKLCDFGSSTPILSRKAPKSFEEVKRLEEDLSKHTTLQYRAPEMVDVYQRRIIDEKADIWAMGVLLYKLCYYTTPFEENGGGPLAILNARYRFPQMPPYSQRLKDLIGSMLQEQSTSRPTIDQVVIGVHRILGTTPPASAVHYADLAASGKQMQPLPSVISSTRTMTGSGADIAAATLAKKRQTTSGLPPTSTVVDKDLIEKVPSEAERRRAEQEELRERSEGITPMRRGRPNRPAGSSSAAATTTTAAPPPPPPPVLSFHRSRSASPTKRNADNVPSQSSGAELGFKDSFAPSSVAAGGLQEPSRPGSGLSYSPTMPGLGHSNRVSPLPKAASPLPPPASQPEEMDEAQSRFPSVEQLDLQYGTGRVSKVQASSGKPMTPGNSSPLASPPLRSHSNSISSSSSRAQLIPGLSDRAPVSAIAGKFSGMASAAAEPKTGAAKSPSVVVSPSTTYRSLGGRADSISSRWPHGEKGDDSSYQSSMNVSKERDLPTLPNRKPKPKDWPVVNGQDVDRVKGADPLASNRATAPAQVNTTTNQSTAHTVGAREADSSDEESPPEDVDEPLAAARKRQSLMGKTLFEERREAAQERRTTWTKPSSTIIPLAAKGKVKTPDWVQQSRESTTEKGPSPGNPTTTIKESEIDGPLGREQSNTELSKKQPSADEFNARTAAKPPAWDEDDEEMHFLPQPDLNNDKYRTALGMAEKKQSTTSTQRKQYADASTSPGRGTPVLISPVGPTIASAPSSSLASLPPSSTPAREEKPANVLSPRPIRSQTSKDVSGLVSKYQGLNVNSNSDSSNSRTEERHPQQQETAAGNDVEVDSRQSSIVNGNATSAHATRPPPISAAKPSTWSRKDSDGARAALSSRPSLKPWEREAFEKEQVEKYGTLRSVSPEKKLAAEAEQNAGYHSSMKGKHEAQERFSGVSSLISQWQTNSLRGAPGWGTVGRPPLSSDEAEHKQTVRSREDDDIMKRSNTISAGRRPMHGRLPSRDV